MEFREVPIMTNINDIKIEACPSDDLVAYLYDELNAAARDSFETHLADCRNCTDEFAELSFARLDVYEWHRDEFAPLATPRFDIPQAENEAVVSWLDAVRGLFASHTRWATVGGAFALLAAVFGAAFISSMNGTGEVANRPINKNQPEALSTNPPVVETIAQAKPDNEPEIVLTSTDRKIPRAVKAVNRRSDKTPERNRTQPGKAPRLNDFVDEDDTTLRLGDLLADVDTKDK